MKSSSVETPPFSETQSTEPTRPVQGQEASSDVTCQNCRTPLPSSASFCFSCGQRVRNEAITFRLLVAHLVENVFNVRRGFLHTLRSVLVNPGSVARRYLDGQRRTFSNPLTFFLIMATAAFFAIGANEEALLGYMIDVTRVSMTDAMFEPGGAMNEVLGFDSREAYARGYYNVLQAIFSYFMLVQCLFVAAVMRLFFSTYTLAEYMVFSMFVAAQAYIVTGIFMPMMFAVGVSAFVILGLSTLWYPLLYAISGWTFWKNGWKGAFLTGLSAIAGQVLFVMTIGVLSGVFGFVLGFLRARGEM